jgi:RNA polymerase sigma factor (sigma-70 family)
MGRSERSGHNRKDPATTMPRNLAIGCPSGVGGERDTIVTHMGRDVDGDGGRLEEMYVRFAPGGIRLAYLMTGDRAVAEDLVQEAFIRFVGRLHSLRDAGAFEAYLRRTIINLSKNHFRRRALERSDLQRQASQPRPAPRSATSPSTRRCGERSWDCRPASERRSSFATTRICPNPRSPRCFAVDPPRCVRWFREASKRFVKAPR